MSSFGLRKSNSFAIEARVFDGGFWNRLHSVWKKLHNKGVGSWLGLELIIHSSQITFTA